MNEHDELDILLDNALNELPLVPLPDTLIPGIMAQLAPRPQIEPFRLGSADIWLALTLAFGIACVMFIGSMLEFTTLTTGLQALPSLIKSLMSDWRQLSFLLVVVELLLTIAIYLGFTLAPNWRDFDAIPA